MLKKVVVVVDENQKEIFETSKGQNLEVKEHRATGTFGNYVADYLIIKEGDVTLASFTTWMYWRQIE